MTGLILVGKGLQGALARIPVLIIHIAIY